MPHQDSKNESVGAVSRTEFLWGSSGDAEVSRFEHYRRIFSEITAILHVQGLGIITEYLFMQIVSGWHALAISALVWEFNPSNSPSSPSLLSLSPWLSSIF